LEEEGSAHTGQTSHTDAALNQEADPKVTDQRNSGEILHENENTEEFYRHSGYGSVQTVVLDAFSGVDNGQNGEFVSSSKRAGHADSAGVEDDAALYTHSGYNAYVEEEQTSQTGQISGQISGQMNGQSGQMNGQSGQMSGQSGQMSGQSGQMSGQMSGPMSGQMSGQMSEGQEREGQFKLENDTSAVPADGVASAQAWSARGEV
jgi:hypothetical protein